MNPPFPFDTMLMFAFLSALLLVGVLLRAKVRLFQKFLVPSCLIGGFIGLGLTQSGWVRMDSNLLEALAYHCFNISFISVGLTRDPQPAPHSPGGQKIRGALWMALMQGLTFPGQAVIGGLLVIILGMAGVALFPTFGFLVPLGFNEGPGQALSIGKAWESVGFSNAATIGLTFAAVGYFFAFFVGVPLVNRGIRKGLATFGPRELPRDFLTGLLTKSNTRESAGTLTIHSGNAETLAFQAALVGAVYGMTYGVVRLLASFLPPDVGSILWGFFFFFGLGIALLVKKGMDMAGVGHLADPGVQRRITGWSVDYLIVATVAAIQITIVMTYLFPITLMALTSGFLTTLAVIWFGKRLDAYSLERTAAIYGTVTGTVSCGLLLLRIVDPDFKTPVAFEIAVMNVFVLPFVGGGTVLVNGPLWWNWSVALTVGVFAVMILISLTVMRLMKFWGKPTGRARLR